MPDTSPRLPFEIDDTLDPALVAGRAGVPLVIELLRQPGVATTAGAQVLVKQRQRALRPAQFVESPAALWVSGGDRCQDLTTLRESHALATLLGYPLPAAATIRDFLEAFHVEGGPLWQAGPQAAIPLGVSTLAGPGSSNLTLVAGALPSGKSGANAAWFRLDALASNLLSALKRLTGALQHALLVRVGQRIAALAPA